MGDFSSLFEKNEKKAENNKNLENIYVNVLKKALVDMLLPNFFSFIESIQPTDKINLYGTKDHGSIGFSISIIGKPRYGTTFREEDLSNWRADNRKSLDMIDSTYSNEDIRFSWEHYLIASESDESNKETPLLAEVAECVKKKVSEKYPGSQVRLSTDRITSKSKSDVCLMANLSIEHRSSKWVSEQELKVKKCSDFYNIAKNIFLINIPEALDRAFKNDRNLQPWARKISTNYQRKPGYPHGEILGIRYEVTFLASRHNEDHLIDLSSLFSSFHDWRDLLLGHLTNKNEYEDAILKMRQQMYSGLEKELCGRIRLPISDVSSIVNSNNVIKISLHGYGYEDSTDYYDITYSANNRLRCSIDVT